MSRRRAIGGAGLLAALAGAWLARPGRSDPPPAAPAPAAARVLLPPASERADPEPSPSARPPFEARSARVARDCGLPLRIRCGSDGCVSLLVGPDLDRPTGWLSLVAERPAFVASVALRDLGVPGEGLPCGAAIAALGASVRAVELADGTEIWCAADVAAPGPACDAAAEAWFGPEAARFDAPGIRVLRF